MSLCLKPIIMRDHWYEHCDSDTPTANCLSCPNYKHYKEYNMRLCTECKQDAARTNAGLCISCNEGMIEELACDAIKYRKRAEVAEEKVAELEAENERLRILYLRNKK